MNEIMRSKGEIEYNRKRAEALEAQARALRNMAEDAPEALKAYEKRREQGDKNELVEQQKLAAKEGAINKMLEEKATDDLRVANNIRESLRKDEFVRQLDPTAAEAQDTRDEARKRFTEDRVEKMVASELAAREEPYAK